MKWAGCARRWSLAACSGLAISALLAACGGTGTAAKKPAASTQQINGGGASITIGEAPAIDAVAEFGALQLGLFHKYGLNVKIQTGFASGVSLLNALASGTIDFCTLGNGPVLAAAEKGIPVQIVGINHGSAVSSYYNANQGIIGISGSGVTAGDPASLRGKTVAVPFGTDDVPYLDGVLAAAGVPQSAVTMVNASPAEALTSLESHRVAAVVVWEPFESIALATIRGSFVVQEGGLHSFYDPGVIVTNKNYAAAHPRVVEAFLAAVAAAHQWMRTDPSQAAAVAVQWIPGLTKSEAARALQHIGLDPRVSKLIDSGLNSKYIPYLVKLGILPKAIPASQVTDFSYMLVVQSKEPQLFSGLPKIPAADALH